MDPHAAEKFTRRTVRVHTGTQAPLSVVETRRGDPHVGSHAAAAEARRTPVARCARRHHVLNRGQRFVAPTLTAIVGSTDTQGQAPVAIQRGLGSRSQAPSDPVATIGGRNPCRRHKQAALRRGIIWWWWWWWWCNRAPRRHRCCHGGFCRRRIRSAPVEKEEERDRGHDRGGGKEEHLVHSCHGAAFSFHTWGSGQRSSRLICEISWFKFTPRLHVPGTSGSRCTARGHCFYRSSSAEISALPLSWTAGRYFKNITQVTPFFWASLSTAGVLGIGWSRECPTLAIPLPSARQATTPCSSQIRT